MIEDRDLYLNY